MVGAALSLTASDTWVGLLALPIGGALPFLFGRTLRRFLSVFLFVGLGGFGLLVTGELLFRARYFGAASIREFIAYSPLPPTALPDFLSPSGDPEIGDVFTPRARARFNGDLWEINEQGFRDEDFSEEKPADTYRILVLGDSFVVGVGVAREDRFSDQLERMLQQVGARPRVEVYNLGLAGRDVPDLAHLMEKYGPRYSADLVLIAVRASLLHEVGRRNAIRADGDAPLPRAATFSFLRRYSFILNIPREPVQAGLRRAVALLPAWSARPAEAESPPSDGEGGPSRPSCEGPLRMRSAGRVASRWSCCARWSSAPITDCAPRWRTGRSGGTARAGAITRRSLASPRATVSPSSIPTTPSIPIPSARTSSYFRETDIPTPPVTASTPRRSSPG